MFLVGMCLLMHSVLYKVDKVEQETYSLTKTVTIGGREETRKEDWKKSVVDRVGKKADCK